MFSLDRFSPVLQTFFSFHGCARTHGESLGLARRARFQIVRQEISESGLCQGLSTLLPERKVLARSAKVQIS
jgi:hypothetical protein